MPYPFDFNESFFPGYETSLDSILQTVQNQFWWGRESQNVYLPCTISSAARDAGNTVTTTLRGGLLLGKVTSTGELKEWNPTGTDGSQDIFGVLAAPVTVSDGNASVADRYTYCHVRGLVYSDRLLIPGEAAEGIVGHAQEFNILNQLLDRGYLLDKHIQYGDPRTLRMRGMTAAEITADAITVTTADHGRTFNTILADGATAVTLPEPQVGLVFHFVNPVAQTVTLDMTTGKFVTPGSITTDTLALTIGEQVTLTGISTTLYRAEITEAATD